MIGAGGHSALTHAAPPARGASHPTAEGTRPIAIAKPYAQDRSSNALRLAGIASVLAVSIGGAWIGHRTIDDMTDYADPVTLAGLAIAIVPVLVTYLFMKLLGRSWSDYGLRPIAAWKAIGLGSVIAVSLFLLVGYVIAPLVHQLAPRAADISHIAGVRGDFGRYLFVLLVVWVTAALFEELIFRGFLLNEAAELFGGRAAGWIGAAFAIAIAFGLGHAYQGLFGVLMTGTIGLLLALAYLFAGRNLWPLIVAHGLFDTYGITMLYLA